MTEGTNKNATFPYDHANHLIWCKLREASTRPRRLHLPLHALSGRRSCGRFPKAHINHLGLHQLALLISMSLMTPSTVRIAAAFAVPSTQNTAPVLEFRCLYSHDLRRKSKRWQDGFMRFHTFNKRIMVYDVPRNFIGDTHWREDEAVQDGDELQLEKGVLVQVGEAVGSIEQDLTALFEKKRQKQAGTPGKVTSPPRPTLLAAARSTAAPLSQLRPKSLNALLGTPRGSHGKATLPTKSPYEHRQRLENENLKNGRACKRQRLDSSPSRNTDTPLWVRTADAQRPSRYQQKQKQRVAYPASKSTKNTDREIIEVVSSDEETPAPQHVRQNRSSWDNDRLNQRQSSPDVPSLFLSQISDKSSTGAEIARRDVVAEPPEYSLTTTEQVAPVHTTSDTVVNPLRIIARKPRKKLMYKDLLRQRPPSRGKAGDRRRQASDDCSKDLGNDVWDCPGTVEDLGKLQNGGKTQEKARSRDQRPQAERDSPESSGAFSETDRGIDISTSEVPLPARELAQKRLDSRPNTSITISPKDAGPHMVAPSRSSTTPSEAAPYGFGKAPARSSYVTKGTRNTGLELSELDKILVPRPGPTGISTSSDSKARGPEVFKTNANPKDVPISPRTVPEPIQSVPENNNLPPPRRQAVEDKSSVVPQPQPILQVQQQRLPARPQPPPFPQPRSPLRKALSESDKIRPPTTNKCPPPNRSLQRATSDMSGLRRKARDAVGPVPDKGMLNDNDLGPWSREAFDLFGWMPEGKGKV